MKINYDAINSIWGYSRYSKKKMSTNFVRKLYGKLVRKLILLMDSSFCSYEDKLKSFCINCA